MQLGDSGEAVALLAPGDSDIHPLAGQGAFHEHDFAIRTADAVPGVLPADETVAEARRALFRNGFYDGPITGKADSRTREAIKEFQASRNLKVDGFVRDSPVSVLGERTLRLTPIPQ